MTCSEYDVGGYAQMSVPRSRLLKFCSTGSSEIDLRHAALQTLSLLPGLGGSRR